MSVAAQLLVNGVVSGALYALVAAGFSIIYSVARCMHFAHGAVVAAGAYGFFFFSKIIGLHWSGAVVLALCTAGVVGLTMNSVVYRPLRVRKSSGPVILIASVALMTLVNSLILLLFGADVKTVGLDNNPVFEVLGARVTLTQLLILATATLFFFGLWILMKRTRTGIALRAVADNPVASQIVGISAEKTYFTVFLIGSIIAGVAGILVGIENNLYPQMGTALVIKGFTGAVVGGISVVHGSVLGGLLLGLVENFGIWYIPSGYKDAISFMLLVVFLLLRPQGLLGESQREV